MRDGGRGTAALSDARSILSIAISHNMDNIDPIDDADLQRYMGLDTNNKDASGSKTMNVTNNQITYTYTRGGVTLTGTIDIASQKTTWECSGVKGNANREQAICEGLKVDYNGGAPTNLTFS